MSQRKASLSAVGLAWLTGVSLTASEVREPAGSIPVMDEVDVLVVGGTSGGVEAAVAAAQAGAKVFLAAPRPYLGEDICASQRFWLEPGEVPLTPLAEAVFAPVQAPRLAPLQGGYPFTYNADRPAAARHPDTPQSSRLRDGKWHSAAAQSVEYSGAVNIDLDLGEPRQVRNVVLMAYQRRRDFEVDSLTVSASDDGRQWQQLATRRNDLLDIGPREEMPLRLDCDVSARTRYLRVRVEPTTAAERILLGEIIVLGESPEPVAAARGPQPVTPMQVKLALDRALTAAGVPFLYPSIAVGLLQAQDGQPAGIVMANRSGLQAVIAKVLIDATERATVTRWTGAEFRPFPRQPQLFRRVVVGGPPRAGDGVSLVQRDPPLTLVDRKADTYTFLEYQLRLPLRDASFASFAEAEQLARDLTWTRESSDASETLFHVPPDSFRSAQPLTASWPGAGELPLDCLRPVGVDNVYVLGGCADVTRDAAMQLLRPVNLMAVGARLGKLAAQTAVPRPAPRNVRVASRPGTNLVPGEVRVGGAGVSGRTGERTVPAPESALPVWGEYDVVVVGGGTGGAPAAIGAGRQGARTLLIEFLHELGGVGTAGLITKYYYGNRVGFTAEVDKGVNALAGGEDERTSGGGWSPLIKSEWYRRELRKAGVEIWFGALGHGAVVDNGRVTGVVVVTPFGRGVVRAKVVVDSTGNADIAAAAGAPCRYTDDTEVAVQGTGLPPRDLDARYVNTDYLFVDDTDIVDIWRAFVTAREKYRHNHDLAQLVDTRERRQIVGDFVLMPMDFLLARTFPDTIVISRSNFDSHGYTVHALFMLRPPDREVKELHVPYRCLLPRGVDGILVTGLGVSAHRDALPIIRMQADIQNQGYAAGVAAAWIARDGIPTRKLDVKRLQQHLVEIGNLPAAVLTHVDSFPLPDERFREAADRVVNEYADIEVLLTDVERTKPLLRERLARATNASHRLVYAHILGVLGDSAGAAILREAVRRGPSSALWDEGWQLGRPWAERVPLKDAPWDEGWQWRGGGQYRQSMSRLDSYIIALGRTRDREALPVLLEKAAALTADSEFSHFRAIALALESLADPAAAPALARLLRLEGVGGHAVTEVGAAVQRQRTRPDENRTRGRELAELSLARALYRCGDYQALGERTLRQYARGLNGHYARHALAVLQGRGR